MLNSEDLRCQTFYTDFCAVHAAHRSAHRGVRREIQGFHRRPRRAPASSAWDRRREGFTAGNAGQRPPKAPIAHPPPQRARRAWPEGSRPPEGASNTTRGGSCTPCGVPSDHAEGKAPYRPQPCANRSCLSTLIRHLAGIQWPVRREHRSVAWAGIEPACANLPHHRPLSAGSVAMRARLCHPRLHTLRSPARRGAVSYPCLLYRDPALPLPCPHWPRSPKSACHSGKRSRPSSAGSLWTCNRTRGSAAGALVLPTSQRRRTRPNAWSRSRETPGVPVALGNYMTRSFAGQF